MGAAARRQQRMMDLVFNVLAETKGAVKQMTSFQQQTLQQFDKMNKNMEQIARKSQRRISRTAKKTQSDMQKVMAAPFIGGGRGGIGQVMDDFVFRERQMRGVTTGLRHEVGKIRNTLLLFVFATHGIVSAFKEWFQSIIQAEAALTGLKAVAISTGLNFERLRDVALDMEQRGFLSLGGSAAALKNLAAANLSMTESIGVLRALTDAAAFNRQGTLSMEEAIVGATQGIKNQNSIMIDNAGITKNVSIMYREYAAMIGKTSGTLTEMEKRQAIVNGILQEASLFAGNAEKSLGTYAGRLTKFRTSMLSIKRDLGEIIAGPILQAVEKFGRMFDEVGKTTLGQSFVLSIAHAAEQLTTIFTSVIVNLTKNIEALNSTFEKVGLGLTSIIESPMIRLAAFGVLLRKVGTYFSGLLTKARTGSLTKSLDLMKSESLRDVVIQQGKYQVLQKGTVQYAMQEAEIRTRMNLIMEKGTASETIRVAYQKRINELLAKQNLTKQQALEIDQKAQILRELGYSAVVQNKAQRVGSKGGMKQKGSVYFGQGLLPDKNQTQAFKGYMSEAARMHLSLKEKIIQDYRLIKREWAKVGAGFKAGWAIYKQGVFQSIVFTNNLKRALITTAQAVKTVGAIALNVVGKLFMYFTMAQVVWDLLKDLFGGNKQDLEAINRELELELTATEGIKKNFREISNSLAAHARYFKSSGGAKTYYDVMTKTGDTFGQMSDQMDLLVKKIIEAEFKLKAYQFQVLQGGEANEKAIENTTKELEKLKTKYNEVYRSVVEANDKFNQGFEETLDFITRIGNTSKGSFAQVLKNTSKLYEDLKMLETNRSVIEKLPLSIDGKSIEDEAKKFEYFVKLAYTGYYKETEKIVQAGEQKITQIMKDASKLRLQLVRDSVFKQALTIEETYINSLRDLEQELQKIQIEAQAAKFDTQLQVLNLDLLKNKTAIENLNNSMNIIDASWERSTVKNIDFARALTTFSNILDKAGYSLDEFRENMDTLEASFFGASDLWMEEAKGVASYLFKIEEIDKEITALEKKYEEYRQGQRFVLPTDKLKEFGEEIDPIKKKIIDLTSTAVKGGQAYETELDAIGKLALGDDMYITEEYAKMLQIVGEAYGKVTLAQLRYMSNVKSTVEADATLSAMTKELEGQLSTYQGVLDEQARLLGQNGKLIEEVYGKALADLMEQISKTTKEDFNYITSLGTMNMLQKENSLLVKDLSKSYVDASGNLVLVGKSYVDLQTKVFEANRGLELQKELLIEYFDEALKKASPDMILYLTALKQLVEDTTETKKAIATMETYAKAVGKYYQTVNEAALGQARFNEAIKKFTDAEVISFITNLAEAIEEYYTMLDALDKSFIGPPTKEQIEDLKKGVTTTIEKVRDTMQNELDKLAKSMKRKTSMMNVWAGIVNVDWAKIDENNDRLDQWVEALKESKSKLDATQQGIVDDAIKIIEDLKTKLQLDELIEGIKQTISQLSSFFYDLGGMYGAARQREKELMDERRLAVEEQAQLYAKGEITAQEKMDRIAKIHSYYAQQIDDVWKQIGHNVLQSVMEMGSKIITQIGQQVAAAMAIEAYGTGVGGNWLGAIGAGLTAFLPFGAIIAGIGLVNSMLAQTPTYDPLEFEEPPQSQLSKFGGTIKAEEVTIHINPSFIIEGNQVFIGSGSVVEYVEEATELMKEGVQQAIDNQEFSFDNVRAVGRS